jgi:hypothetical protein
MGALFRSKFLDQLRQAHAAGHFARFDAFEDPEAFDRFMATLARKNWVVYAKRAFGGPEQVYRYLGRYTHRVGIANSRLVSLHNDAVTFRTKDGKAITIAATEFLRRFLLHILPARFVKMRHFGLLAAGNVNTKLVRARRLLKTRNVHVLSPRRILATLDADARRCPVCRIGILRAGALPPTPVHVWDSS